jgi:excisionase family DNA binding protein
MTKRTQSAPERLLTPAQAAERLQIKRSFIYSLLASGALPCVRLSRLRRVSERDLEDFISRHRAAPPRN